MAIPRTRQVQHTDEYFGCAVSDPYRWLEGSSGDEEIASWVRTQSEYARNYLDALSGRSAIRASLDELTGLPLSTAPARRGNRWFRFTTDGRQEQQVLRVADSPMGEGQVVIDPNSLAAGSTTSIASASPSPDGSLVAYSYSEAGSDWLTWRVREVATGEDLPDLVEWSKFTTAEWLPDGTGFFFGAFAPGADSEAFVDSLNGHKLKLHRLGLPPAQDSTVLELPDEPDVIFSAEVTDDDRWLVVTGERGTDPTNRLWLLDLTDPSGGIQTLIAEDTAKWQPIASSGGSLVLLTDLDAPRGRVVSVEVGTGALTELVRERSQTLESGYPAGGRLVLHWLQDAHSVVTVHATDGEQLGEIDLPGIGSLLELTSRADDPLLHLAFTSFAVPLTVLRHDLGSGISEVAFQAVANGLESVVAEQVWYASADGTAIPMFLVHRSDVSIDGGPHPTLLYGYGGFRISVQPAFKPVRAAFIAAGGVLAVPSLRGGGEYGAAWHDAGRLSNKQNVFDDAIAAAEYLVEQGWTTSDKLACNGGSNGGLLVGALLTQRPDLFAAAVPEVGVLDVLRFKHFTIGWAWTSDYGDVENSKEEFETAFGYSPYHRVSRGRSYPPTMVMTSDHDDRVVPAHSYKFAARLQSVSTEDSVALLRVELDSGHGAGRARSAMVEESTDLLAFLSRHTGLRWPQ